MQAEGFYTQSCESFHCSYQKECVGSQHCIQIPAKRMTSFQGNFYEAKIPGTIITKLKNKASNFMQDILLFF